MTNESHQYDCTEASITGRMFSIVDEADEPMTASEINDTIDVSRATLYRSLNRLEEYGMIEVVGYDLENTGVRLWQRTSDTFTLSFDGEQATLERGEQR